MARRILTDFGQARQITEPLPATQRRRRTWVALLLALSQTTPAASEALALSEPKGSTLTSDRSVIASGGGTSTGGVFVISGTIGQADVDPLQPSTGGDFAITGGFWPTLAPTTDLMFSNGFEGP